MLPKATGTTPLPTGAAVLLHAPLLVPSDAAARGRIQEAAAGRAQCQCTKNRLGDVLDEPHRVKRRFIFAHSAWAAAWPEAHAFSA